MNCANHPDRERIAFCQNCGKPLCQECTRTVGSAVFCEPCLAARIGATMPPSGGTSYSYTNPATGAQFSGTEPGPGATAPGGYSYVDPASGIPVNGAIPPPRPGHNPWLAGGLGFIPGVGAMYNEQYAKGIVHLVVFAVLISLADNHGIFGLFIAGWIFYMAIEAYHTAAARRDGHPLPNPFGLNDIGERLGFGKAWSAGHPQTPAAAAQPMPDAGAPPYTPPYTPPAAGFVPPANAWGAPPPPPPAYQAPGYQAGYPSGYQAGYYPPVPPMPIDDPMQHAGARFPIGAIWLIVLGALFLVANSGIFHGFSGRFFVPLLLLGLAAWVFLSRMTGSGSAYSEYGSPGYQLRIFRAASGAAWLALVGLLFLLDDFGILTWAHSWPLYIILAGVMAVFKRAAYSAVATVPYSPQYPYGAPAAQPATEPAGSAAGSSMVPSSSDDAHDGNHHQEGR
jgi:hypothetical protein